MIELLGTVTGLLDDLLRGACIATIFLIVWGVIAISSEMSKKKQKTEDQEPHPATIRVYFGEYKEWRRKAKEAKRQAKDLSDHLKELGYDPNDPPDWIDKDKQDA